MIVHDFQLSLAIGKEGQNARLAARLTGWRIDIKSETQIAEEEAGYTGEEWAEGEWITDDATGEMMWKAADGTLVSAAEWEAGLGGDETPVEPATPAETVEETVEEPVEESIEAAAATLRRSRAGRSGRHPGRGAGWAGGGRDHRGPRRHLGRSRAGHAARGARLRGRGITPERTCIGCRRVAPAGELVRVVRTDDGALVLGRHLPGRGAWLCAGSVDCVATAERRKAFERALKGPISAEAVARLREQWGQLCEDRRPL